MSDRADALAQIATTLAAQRDALERLNEPFSESIVDALLLVAKATLCVQRQAWKERGTTTSTFTGKNTDR